MRIENYDYSYELTDEQLLYYSSLPAIAKLRWLDEARRFTLLARKAKVIERIRCRVAACREALDDGKEWSFYLINDSADPLDLVLERVSYEWGDMGNSEDAEVRVTGLARGAHALLWRDDGSGAEVRMDLSLRVRMRGREVKMLFEFPKLYRQRDLPLVDGLGKPAWQVAAEG